MSMFTIRVELHDANWQQYVDMAKDLATKGITDVIVGDNGTSYKMPPAEYHYSGTALIGQVLESVKASAAKTGKRYGVLVTEATRISWEGLQPIQSRRSA